ncbi:MAG TPA: ribonuclease D [Alphaproteobacteria bacterium]|nr:ribonuclease D [Alphaproteobacteria bacterium]
MTITLHKNDLPANIDFGTSVAVDTESMGLNWERDRLCLVQLSSGDGNAHLVQLAAGKYDAPNLKKLMADPKVTKLFHYARADIVTIKYYLGVMPKPLYCTKIASVLARTFSDRHGLKDLTKDLISLDLSKEQQTSDWGAATLTQDQMNYAASDVLHLHKLKARLDEMLARENRTELAKQVMEFLPVRAELDIAGWRDIDVFSHRPQRKSD